MARTISRGPLLEFEGKTISRIPCIVMGTPHTVDVKVNKSGWPYVMSAFQYEFKPQDRAAAALLIEAKGARFNKNYKAGVLAAWNEKPVIEEPDSEDVFEAAETEVVKPQDETGGGAFGF